MTALPPLILLLQPRPDRPETLVAVLEPGGRARAWWGGGPDHVPPGALLVHWPGRFLWVPPVRRLGEEARAAGGAILPLRDVLRRLGLKPGRGMPGLVRALAPALEDVEDLPHLGARLLEGLAERLDVEPDDPPGTGREAPSAGRAAGPAPSAEAVYRPRPEILLTLEDLPRAPGVYTFTAADGGMLYVGKARSLRHRVPRHFDSEPAEPAKSRELVRRAARLEWEETGSELEALLREQIRLGRGAPPLNTQDTVHVRPRGGWRRACVLLVLPAARPREVDVCLVSGDGRFHWQRVPGRDRVPRDLGRRLRAFLAGEAGGWPPGEPGCALAPEEARALAEITLSWLARHGDSVSRIDLSRERPGRDLDRRLRALLREDPRRRVEPR